MLTVGGVAAESQKQAQKTAVTPPCDWEVKGVGVYDMSDLIWGSVFDANDSAYEVPAAVVSTIGGR